MKAIDIAKIAHQANKAYCETLGDTSQKDWHNAPEWQKKSVINGVEFHIANPNAQPEDSHNNWLAEKERDGWEYGKYKDEQKKTHPCFRPYNELPEPQRLKDSFFIAVVNTFREVYDPEGQ